MTRPPYLVKGDKVGIVAPARKITMQELQPALDMLHNWGLEAVLGKNVYHSQDQFSGTDHERAEDFQDMLDDASIKAVFCARGGYGTMRIIDKLNFTAFKKQSKWIVGYSDATVLHAHIHVNTEIETLHATMPINFLKSEKATETMHHALFGKAIDYHIKPHELNRKGVSEGEMVGGNLSLLYALMGSKSEVDTRGKILFIEDLDEYLYHIDRMILSLKRAGKLDQLEGLIVGGLTDMKDNPVPFGKTAEEIIMEAVEEYDYPVCFNFPAGHIDANMPIFLGRKSRLNIGAADIEFKQH